MDGQMFQGQTSPRVEKSMFCTFIEKKNKLPHMQTEVHRDVTHIRDKGRRDHRELENLSI